MSPSRIYADFNNLDDLNRLKLTCAGTREDLERHGIEMREGLILTFYMDDADDQGRPDELCVEGVVHFDADHLSWIADVDWSKVRHESAQTTQAINTFQI
jgi:hypothetical protein